MRIPKSFQLGAHEIVVVRKDKAKDMGKDMQMLGQSIYQQNRVMVAKGDSDGKKICLARQGDVFCHELTHYLFNAVNRIDLQKDEKLVSDIAGYLNQYFASVKY